MALASFEQRKKEHIELSLKSETQGLVASDFSKIKLKHHALPDFNFSDVSLESKLLGCTFSSPHFISSMTAGHQNSEKINYFLAQAAVQKNWLFCVGSQRKELAGQKTNEWEKIHSDFSKLKIVSNIGLEEVVQNKTEEIIQLVKNSKSIGLIIHLNPLQEVFQKSILDL